jgi:hypothetical protein
MFIDTTSPFISQLQRSDMFQTMNNQPRGTFRSSGAAEIFCHRRSINMSSLRDCLRKCATPRGLLVRLVLAVSLVACMVWLVLCLLLTPIVMCMRRWQRKAVA